MSTGHVPQNAGTGQATLGGSIRPWLGGATAAKGQAQPGTHSPCNCSSRRLQLQDACPQPTLSKKPLMFRIPTAGARQGSSGWVVSVLWAGSWVATTAGAWC